LPLYSLEHRVRLGIIPRDGKNVTFKELNTAVRNTYNLAPTISYFVSHFPASFLGKSYETDTFNVEDVNLHNDTAIEHDASLLRMYPSFSPSLKLSSLLNIGRDLHFEPDQSVIHMPYVREVLDSATGKDEHGNSVLTIADFSRLVSKRRAECKVANPDYMLNELHKVFGSQK